MADQSCNDVHAVLFDSRTIAHLATGVRRDVIAAVERTTGLQATEVTTAVAGAHIPCEDEDEDPAEPARVQ